MSDISTEFFAEALPDRIDSVKLIKPVKITIEDNVFMFLKKALAEEFMNRFEFVGGRIDLQDFIHLGCREVFKKHFNKEIPNKQRIKLNTSEALVLYWFLKINFEDSPHFVGLQGLFSELHKQLVNSL